MLVIAFNCAAFFFGCVKATKINFIQHQNLGGSHYSSAGCMIYRPAVYRNLNYSFYVKEKQQALDALLGLNMWKIVTNTKFNTEATTRVMICYSHLFHVSIAINAEEYYKLDVTKLVRTKDTKYFLQYATFTYRILHLLPPTTCLSTFIFKECHEL